MELFTTIGKVERAEIQYEPNGRSRGTGVVEFDSAENAETAIGTLFSLPEHVDLADLSTLTLAQPSSRAISMAVVRSV